MTREQQKNHSDFKVIRHSMFDGFKEIKKKEAQILVLQNLGFVLLSSNAAQSVYGLPK